MRHETWVSALVLLLPCTNAMRVLLGLDAILKQVLVRKLCVGRNAKWSNARVQAHPDTVGWARMLHACLL